MLLSRTHMSTPEIIYNQLAMGLLMTKTNYVVMLPPLALILKRHWLSMGNHTVVQAGNKEGEHLSVQHTSTDSPILPAENIRQLQNIDPNLVSFVIEQTAKEAEFRRTESKRINTMVFTERISGVVAGAIIAIVVFTFGFLLILKGHDWAGVALCGAALVSIISIFVTKKISEKPESITKPQPRRIKKR